MGRGQVDGGVVDAVGFDLKVGPRWLDGFWLGFRKWPPKPDWDHFGAQHRWFYHFVTIFHGSAQFLDIFRIPNVNHNIFLFSKQILTNENKPKPDDWSKVCFQNKIY